MNASLAVGKKQPTGSQLAVLSRLGCPYLVDLQMVDGVLQVAMLTRLGRLCLDVHRNHLQMVIVMLQVSVDVVHNTASQ